MFREIEHPPLDLSCSDTEPLPKGFVQRNRGNLPQPMEDNTRGKSKQQREGRRLKNYSKARHALRLAEEVTGGKQKQQESQLKNTSKLRHVSRPIEDEMQHNRKRTLQEEDPKQADMRQKRYKPAVPSARVESGALGLTVESDCKL
jgi:hypothetical protein